jgi:uncharacterized protein YbjT (DUF2867 family)|tara:strand:- start:3343 stop:4011 length:669 start_codon:yes stop_codon:yes gene_type:complete
MVQMGKTAVVLGATGVVGKLLTLQLLQDYRYEQIHIIGRSPLDFDHYKIKETLYADLEKGLKQHPINGDHLYCCLGSTKAKTPKLEAYKKIDVALPLLASLQAKEALFEAVVVVSSLGANAHSKNFYSQMKGEMEHQLEALNLPKIHFVQPSLILGGRKEFRLGERIGKGLMSSLFFLWKGPLKEYKPIQAKDIAKAMIWLANTPYDTKKITSSKLIEIAHY